MKKKVIYSKKIWGFLAIFLLMAILSLSLPTVGLSALVWSASKTPLKFVGPNAMAPTDQNTIYAGTADLPILGTHNGNGMWKTTNGGTNWSQINDANLISTWWEFAIAVDPATSNTVYVSPQTTGSSMSTLGQGVYKTTNGGTNWYATNTGLPTPNTSQCNVSSIAIDEHTGAIYAGTIDLCLAPNHQGIFKSTNEGDSWYPINTGIITDNLGMAYVTTTPVTDNIYCTVAGQYLLGAAPPRVYKSTNGGDNWANVSGNLGSIAWNAGLIIYLRIGEKPQSDSSLYLSAYTYVDIPDQGLYKTTNSGTNWTKIKDGKYGSAYLVPNDPSNIYIGGECTESAVHKVGCFHSTNTGASWFLENDGLPTPNPAVAFMSMTPDGSKIYASVRKDPGGNPDGNDADGVYKGVLSHDSTPPTGSILINGGDSVCHSTQVTLTLSATDTGSGISKMMISNNNNFSGAGWENYAISKPWNLASGADGLRTVYAKYKDGNNNESSAYSASINLVKIKEIKRLAGDDRYLTAIEISKKGWNSANTVILTRGDLFPDALAGAPLASLKDAPILLTSSQRLSEKTRDEIKRLNAKVVYILGSEDAVYKDVENDLINQCGISKGDIHRLGGESRYETAAMIASELPSPQNKTAIIAYGENYPDALSAASIAAYNRMPILMVKLSSVPSAIQDVLKTLNINRTIIAGQPDVVSSEVENWLGDHGYDPDRLGGETRYDTCKLLADYGVKNLGIKLDIIGVAFGENFPDALTLGPLAGKMKAPVILVRDKFIPISLKQYITDNKDKIYTVYIAGQADVVSDEVKDEIADIIGAK